MLNKSLWQHAECNVDDNDYDDEGAVCLQQGNTSSIHILHSSHTDTQTHIHTYGVGNKQTKRETSSRNSR